MILTEAECKLTQSESENRMVIYYGWFESLISSQYFHLCKFSQTMRDARTNVISARIIVMDKKCDTCEFLSHPTPKTQILETEYQSIGSGNNHAYFGRAYVTLKKHKNSLSSLSNEEWSDFEEIVRKLEKAYKDAFGAEPLNWGCFMNHAFRTEPFNSTCSLAHISPL